MTTAAATQPGSVLEFCQHVDAKTGRRCVLSFGHVPPDRHDLQPRSSASVRSILRREDDIRHSTGGPRPLTREHLDAALTAATDAPAALPAVPPVVAVVPEPDRSSSD